MPEDRMTSCATIAALWVSGVVALVDSPGLELGIAARFAVLVSATVVGWKIACGLRRGRHR
jgi:hypothetical protein